MIKRSCANCFWNDDMPCEHFNDNICTHHKFLEGLGKNLEIIYSLDYSSKENIFIIEYDDNENILKVLRLISLGEDGYDNYMISLFCSHIDSNNFKISFQPFDNEDIYKYISEFYDSIDSKSFNSIDGISLNNLTIKKESVQVTLEFTKCDFNISSPNSVNVLIGDYFSCLYFSCFDELYSKLSSISSENKKVQEKVLKLHW